MTSWNSNSKLAPFSSFLTFPVITTEKLIRSTNYSSRAASIELWFMGRGVEDHLPYKAEDREISEIDKANWTKIHALLCNSLWQSIDPQLYPIYKAYGTCYGI